jgi:flavin-dependent dehydrogenase
MKRFDVLVVGGGPAGATVAALCAGQGFEVGLIEHRRFPREKVCGDVINPNCWPVLERSGAAAVLRSVPHQRLGGAEFTVAGCAPLAVAVPGGRDGDGDGLIAVRRSVFDAALLARARAAGARVFEGLTAHGLRGRGRLTSGDGEFTARFIVGTDGRHSVVARAGGLARSGTADNRVAVQARLRAPETLGDRVQLHLFAGGYCGLARLDQDTANLCVVAGRDVYRRSRGWAEFLEATVLGNPHVRRLGADLEPLGRVAAAHPLRRPMQRPAGDGVLLAGDALCVTEPFTGQGIFFALRSAELAAECIGASLRGAGQDAGAQYAAAVARLYRQRARTNRWLRRLMCHAGWAAAAMTCLGRCPAALGWLAGNVVAATRADGRLPRSDRGGYNGGA